MDSKRKINSELFGLVIIAALFLTVPWIDRPFHSRGEPREALVAQSMVATGNWISPPAYNGAVPSKPPFSHWLISLASLPLGTVTETTSRLPSAIAFVLFSCAFFRFLAQHTSSHSALLASLILLSSAEWFRAGVTCRVDTILSTSLAGGLLALFSWRTQGRRGFPWLAGVLFTFAALTKGPIGVALPLAIFSIYELLVGERSVRSIFCVGFRAAKIALPVMVIVACWYVAGYLERGDAFLEKIWYENFARITSAMEDEPHKHSALYLLGMLLVGLLPWTIVWAWAALRRGSWACFTLKAVRKTWHESTELQRFAFVCAASIFVFFCIPSSKRSVYLLPAYPFMAILAAEAACVWSARAVRLMRGLSCGLVGIGAVIGGGALMVALFPFRPELLRFSHAFFESLTLLRVMVVLVLTGIAFRYYRGIIMNDPVHRLAISLVGAVVVLSLFVAEPIFYQLSPKEWLSSKEFKAQVDLGVHEQLYSFGTEAYASSFYLKKPFFSATPGIPTGAIVFVEQRNLERFQKEISSHIREVARFSSGVESERKNVVVVEVLAPS